MDCTLACLSIEYRFCTPNLAALGKKRCLFPLVKLAETDDGSFSVKLNLEGEEGGSLSLTELILKKLYFLL